MMVESSTGQSIPPAATCSSNLFRIMLAETGVELPMTPQTRAYTSWTQLRVTFTLVHGASPQEHCQARYRPTHRTAATRARLRQNGCAYGTWRMAQAKCRLAVRYSYTNSMTTSWLERSSKISPGRS